MDKSKKTVPGPGKYNVSVDLGRKGFGFGNSKRGELDNGPSKKVPGPGAYNTTNSSSNLINAGPKYGYLFLP